MPDPRTAWTDVRVFSEDVILAVVALHALYPDAWFCCQPHPPAAGPEAEVTIENVSEAAVRECLRLARVSVLASRTRPPEPPADDPWP